MAKLFKFACADGFIWVLDIYSGVKRMLVKDFLRVGFVH